MALGVKKHECVRGTRTEKNANFFSEVIYYEHTGFIAFVRRVLQASDFLWRMEDIHCSNVSTHLSMSTPFLSLSYSIKLEAVR